MKNYHKFHESQYTMWLTVYFVWGEGKKHTHTGDGRPDEYFCSISGDACSELLSIHD